MTTRSARSSPAKASTTVEPAPLDLKAFFKTAKAVMEWATCTKAVTALQVAARREKLGPELACMVRYGRGHWFVIHFGPDESCAYQAEIRRFVFQKLEAELVAALSRKERPKRRPAG